MTAPTPMRPAAPAQHAFQDGQKVRISNDRGETVLHLKITDAPNPGVIIVESIWPNATIETGVGINVLTSAEPASPVGGAVFHDTAVWVRAVDFDPTNVLCGNL